MLVISPDSNEHSIKEAAARFKAANKAVALTGAGISVASGIPDFRSSGGLWTIFSPAEYATIEIFLSNPAKAWKLYRALGRVLLGKEPNPAHHALYNLENKDLLQGIITQNVDNLHHHAGNKKIFEIHGDHQHLHCLQCGLQEAVTADHYQDDTVPTCTNCGFPLKPNVVLFGEAVRDLDAIYQFLNDCDLLLVLGTSAQVYPAAGLPDLIQQQNGQVYVFNQEPAPVNGDDFGPLSRADYFFQGDLTITLPAFVSSVLQQQ